VCAVADSSYSEGVPLSFGKEKYTRDLPT
jgi:hypothetical protein